MNRTFLAGLASASCLAVVALTTPAKALRIASPPLPMRAAAAELVVVGKVTGYGPRMVKMNGTDHQVALVSVSESIIGKAGKQVKVAFVPPMAAPVPPGRPIRPGFRRFGVNLTIGMEACFLLNKAPEGELYVVSGFDGLIPRNAGAAENPNFATEVAEARKAGRLLANPKAGLKSANAEERLTTAAILINRYRTQRVFSPTPKTEMIDADESKLILEVLANANWAPGGRLNFMMNPQNLFSRLEVTPADGWVQPKDFRNFEAEAKKWLKANSGTYRIKRFTNEPAPKS